MISANSLPDDYSRMDPYDLSDRIAAHRRELGERLCILAHHYQRDEIVEQADFVGDSLKLSQLASRQRKAEYIVFCGVHFMAESAALLAAPGQHVILPNLRAGCPMASMADRSDVLTAMEELGGLTGEKVIPVAYVNSTAAAKAATGAFGGACCTSSNALNVFCWALSRSGAGAGKILMLPDEHLGRNTALALGYGADACVLYDPALPNGGLTAKDVDRAKFVLWKGHCYVHQQFTVEHITAARDKHTPVCVMVHPECRQEVVIHADMAGSTEQIINAVAQGKRGSRWAIGTENHLVERLAWRYPDRTIVSLSPRKPVCVQMQQIDLSRLLWALDNLAAGRATNEITVPDNLAADAQLALRRMLDVSPTQLAAAE